MLCIVDLEYAFQVEEAWNSNQTKPKFISSYLSKKDFGTPEEDAYIRYERRIIRTPLPAYETFKDDPLRVLICIRFASRFQFEIFDDIALNEKISRGRIGLEVDKMIKGHDPTRAIDLILNLGLYDIVFSSPPQETIVAGKFEDSKFFRQLNEDEKRKLYMAACTLPYKDMIYTEKRKRHPACRFCNPRRVKGVNLLFLFSNPNFEKPQQIELHSTIGLLIRELGSG
ncbi:8042_t:CDS:2, partial [Funneliformis caledonium]